MTNLDVMATVLSEVTNQPIEDIRGTIIRGVGASNASRTQLMTELPDDEANELLAKLRTEKQGILRWLVDASVMAHRRN